MTAKGGLAGSSNAKDMRPFRDHTLQPEQKSGLERFLIFAASNNACKCQHPVARTQQDKLYLSF